MSDYAVTVNLSDHNLDDRWWGIAQIGPVLVNTIQPSNALTRVVCTFKRNGLYPFVFDSDAGADGTITINDAATWDAMIPDDQDFVTFAGDWDWYMQFYEATKTYPLTLYKGVLTVHPKKVSA